MLIRLLIAVFILVFWLRYQPRNPKPTPKNTQELVACCNCNTLVARNSAIFWQQQIYCSKICYR